MNCKPSPHLIRVLIIIIFAVFVLQDGGFSRDKAGQIDELMKLYQKHKHFNGTVLVAEEGRLIFKKGYGLAVMEWNIPHRPDTKLRIGSITKQFTSMLIMQLVEEGGISLDGKLSDYLPYYRKDSGEKVTVHQLLVHNSGIPSYTRKSNFFPEFGRDPYGVKKFIQQHCSDDLEFEPGAKFSYNNSGYFLLGAIIEEITGKTYEAVLNEKILDPLGMKNTGYDHHDILITSRAAGYKITMDGFENAPYLDMSIPYAAGSLYSTVEDLYLWDQALYTEKLLSPKSKEILFRPYVKALGGHYAYGWEIREKKIPGSEEKKLHIFHAGGIHGFNSLIDRQVTDRHLVVLLNSAAGANLSKMSEGIFNILYGRPFKKPLASIAAVLFQTIKMKGVDTAIAQYQELKDKYPDKYNFRFGELNRLGNHLLYKKKDIDSAIAIFKLNVKANPKLSHVYSSLAEAYAEKGNKNLAVKNYTKALELDSQNKKILEMLNELMKEE